MLHNVASKFKTNVATPRKNMLCVMSKKKRDGVRQDDRLTKGPNVQVNLGFMLVSAAQITVMSVA